jgi:hypothetical protein
MNRHIRCYFVALGCIASAVNLSADTISPNDLTTPFAVQPSAGLVVSAGTTEPFFSVLASPPFVDPGVVDILADIQAIDNNGNPISGFEVTGVTITQGSNLLTPTIETFSLTSPITYTDTLFSFNSVTVDPSNLNLAFAFVSDPSFSYSYTLSVTGIPNGGFILYNDVEGAAVPEPEAWWLTAGLAAGILLSRRWWRKQRAA